MTGASTRPTPERGPRACKPPPPPTCRSSSAAPPPPGTASAARLRTELPSKPTCWPSCSTNSGWTTPGGRFSEAQLPPLAVDVVSVVACPRGWLLARLPEGDYRHRHDGSGQRQQFSHKLEERFAGVDPDPAGAQAL